MKESHKTKEESVENIYQGDCFEVMKKFEDQSIDLIYLDPPFFTNKTHKLLNKDRSISYSFDDIWDSHKAYAEFMLVRLLEARRLLKDTGNVFIHCDKSASHILRLVGEEVFGEDNFLSEIIWTYKRWSNSAKNLLPNHQNILHFSKTRNYKFNKIYTDYSETTNIDQILQKRVRDEFGKAIYARDSDGLTIPSDEKKGVPLSDVWEIPFLNPKAKERTGYPTQKPILLLDRIIELSTDENDIVLDPFCGSGTTMVSAKLKKRKYIGIDISLEAVNLTKFRIDSLVKTESSLLKKGRLSYLNADEQSLSLLVGLDIIPVHRNNGMDAILKRNYLSKPVPIRVQKENESFNEAVNKLGFAANKKHSQLAFFIAKNSLDIPDELIVDGVKIIIIKSPVLEINHAISLLDGFL